MDIRKKIFDFYNKKIVKTCKKYYEPIVYADNVPYRDNKRKCKGCPYEYQTIDGDYGCYIMKNLRKYVNYTPAYWLNK